MDKITDCPRCGGEGCEWCRTHKSAPETSRQAAKRMLPQLGKLQTAVLTCLNAEGDLTQDEIHSHCCRRFGERSYGSYRTRVSELLKKEMVEPTGEIRSLNNRPCVVYRITQKGIDEIS